MGRPRTTKTILTQWLPVVLGLIAGLFVLGSGSSEAGAAPAPTPAVAVARSASAESAFISSINSVRGSLGLRQLQVSGDLTTVARAWSHNMASQNYLYHNPNLSNEVPGTWVRVSENVGVGAAVDQLMTAFINSPSHYRNLTDPEWTHVGVGVVVTGDGTMWTTHNFMHAGAPPPPPGPPPTAAPVTAAPTTAPPPPTTTAPPPPPPTTAAPTTTAPPPPPTTAAPEPEPAPEPEAEPEPEPVAEPVSDAATDAASEDPAPADPADDAAQAEPDRAPRPDGDDSDASEGGEGRRVSGERVAAVLHPLRSI